MEGDKTQKSCCKKLPCHIFTGVLGLLFCLGAGVLLGLGVADNLINEELNKQLVLSLDSPVFDQWMDPAPPIYMQYWLFNVTNPQNVSQGGKPAVEEIGPFTYRLYQPRFDVSFYTNDTVSYRYNHTLVYQRYKSCKICDETLPIRQLNVPLVTVDAMLKNLTIPSFAKSMLEALLKALNDSPMFVSHTAKEWLFGYEDPLLKLVSQFAQLIGMTVPDQFGIFVGFNNSDDGLYLVDTGRGDISKANTIYKWNGLDHLSYWSTNSSNMINGTDGVFMTPKVTTSETLYIYNTDICRSIYVQYAAPSTVRGIDTMRFELPAGAFANTTVNPENAGFCVPLGDCLDAGVLSISPCKQGAPVVVSSPHFYLGAQQYIDGVTGMHPNKHEHETYLNIEPMSGAVFEAQKRLQLNIHVIPSKTFSQLSKTRNVILPFLWLNESVVLDKGSADQFKGQVENMITLAHALPYVLLAVGLFLFILSAGLIANRFMKKSKLKYSVLEENQANSTTSSGNEDFNAE